MTAFRVLVQALICAIWIAACDNPQPPRLCGSISEQTIFVGETVTVDICFDDPNGEMLDFRVFSSDAGVARVTATLNTVTATAVSPGVAVVTMVATDPTGLKAQQSFRVVVPNRPPVAAGTIGDLELMVGDSAAFDVAGYFSEPDGQALTYAAAVSDSARVTASVEGAEVTLVAVAKGTVEVTVTAMDPAGLTASLSFEVKVPNRPPVAVDSIAAREIMVGRADTVDVSPFFADPDGDSLSYAATVSDGTVAGASVSGRTVTVTGLAKGEAVVTVTATDDEGLFAAQSFSVTVPNRPPMVTDTIPGLMLYKDRADTLGLAGYFGDPDGDALTWSAQASDSSVVALGLSATDGTLIVAALLQGDAVVTVTATDTEGLMARQSFAVTVPNRGPTTTDTVPAQTLHKRETVSLDLARHFYDPDGDPLGYTAETSDSAVATGEVTGASLHVRASAMGEATLTITATDPGGLSAEQSFTVTVLNRGPIITESIPTVTTGLGKRDTLDLSLHFSDPDGDALGFAAETSNRRVARTTLAGNRLIIRPISKGTADLTVTATDPDSLSAQQTFTVIVANQPPVVRRAFPELTIAANERLTLPVSGYFADPDREALTYGASTSNADIATATVVQSSLTLRGVSEGLTTLTLTATDSEGLTATLDARLRVSGRVGGAPTIVDLIPDQMIAEGRSRELDVSGYFEDPDGDPLQFTATSANAGVVRASVAGATVTLSAVALGETSFSVTATDPGGLSITLSALVAVVPSGRGPVAAGPIPDQTVEVGQVRTITATAYFHDPDGGDMDFAAVSSRPAIVAAAASGSTVTLTGVAVGRTIVTISATDSDRLSAAQAVAVTVVDNTPQGPEAVGTVPDQEIEAGDEIEIDMADYFTHPGGGALTYTAGTSSPGIASARMVGSVVQVKGQGRGTVRITVVASDSHGSSDTQSFQVIVTRIDTGYHIGLGFASSVSAGTEAAVRSAAFTWMSILSRTEFPDVTFDDPFACFIGGYRVNVTAGQVDDIGIAVIEAGIDGPGGTAAMAGMCAIRNSNDQPVIGVILFDAADAPGPQASRFWVEAAAHEIAHTLGFGLSTPWDDWIRDPSGDEHFAGPGAVAAFNSAGGAGYTGGKVPTEGIAHWRESILGDELMTPTGTRSRPNPLSAITIQAFGDMGYTVNSFLSASLGLPSVDIAGVTADDPQAIDLRGDVARGPVIVVDSDGKVTRVTGEEAAVRLPPRAPAFRVVLEPGR